MTPRAPPRLYGHTRVCELRTDRHILATVAPLHSDDPRVLCDVCDMIEEGRENHGRGSRSMRIPCDHRIYI